MRATDLARLVALAAIWGASFLFMRVAVGSFGAIATAEIRLVLAGATIALYLAIAGKPLDLAHHWRHYAIVGTLNSAAPFALYAWSAQHLPASYLAVINATAPLFGTLVAVLWLGERITPRAALGLAAGVAGVATLVGLGPTAATAVTVVAALAGLVASLCYAVASAFVKRRTYAVDASALAGGSNVAAAALLLPLAIAAPPAGLPTPAAAWAAFGLGVLCTGIAYLLYFRLIDDVGPSRALTVTFLIPAFGMLWGAVFLGEAITATMLAGCALVLVGTGLILGPARATPAQRSPARQ
ncbi:MAG TPA: DMT family transporter [Burkholderiales bacterium]|nr:DMT family transporter [Burkholderiales bacterium]